MSGRRRPGQRFGSQSDANATCQNCLQKGHWTFTCKNPPVYAKRVSRTKILKRPDLYKRMPKEEKPPEILELEEEIAAVENQKQIMKDLLTSCNSDAKSSSSSSESSSDSDSSDTSSDTDSDDSDSDDSDSSSDSSLSGSSSSSDESSVDSRRQRERVRLGSPTNRSKAPKRREDSDNFRRSVEKVRQHPENYRRSSDNNRRSSERPRRSPPVRRERRSRSRSPRNRSSVIDSTKSGNNPTPNNLIHPDRRQFHRR